MLITQVFGQALRRPAVAPFVFRGLDRGYLLFRAPSRVAELAPWLPETPPYARQRCGLYVEFARLGIWCGFRCDLGVSFGNSWVIPHTSASTLSGLPDPS